MEAHLTPEENTILAKAVTLDVQDLYGEIGQLVAAAAMPVSSRELISLGQRWVVEHWEELRTLICPHRDAIAGAGEVAAVAVAIVPFLGPVAPGVAGVLVAVLIAKMGIIVLCREGESDESTE
jgi:hypothetical protein